MNKLDYLITGVFQNDDFSIELPMKSVMSISDDEVKKTADHMDFGEVIYNLKSRTLFHDFDGTVTFITKNSENVRFELLEPRKNIEHETLLGMPIFEPEDYKQLPFSEWEEILYRYCKENDFRIFNFGESISYRIGMD